MNIIIEFQVFELVYASNFSLNRGFWFFEQICPEDVFLVKNIKSERHHGIQSIRISVGTKFQNKQTILSILSLTQKK